MLLTSWPAEPNFLTCNLHVGKTESLVLVEIVKEVYQAPHTVCCHWVSVQIQATSHQQCSDLDEWGRSRGSHPSWRPSASFPGYSGFQPRTQSICSYSASDQLGLWPVLSLPPFRRCSTIIDIIIHHCLIMQYHRYTSQLSYFSLVNSITLWFVPVYSNLILSPAQDNLCVNWSFNVWINTWVRTNFFVSNVSLHVNVPGHFAFPWIYCIHL